MTGPAALPPALAALPDAVRRLPVAEVLAPLCDALRVRGVAVLQAPPGAGKTTAVPLALLAAGVAGGRVLVLEPRRLAARASAERMAALLGEPVGGRVGYRIRGDSRTGPDTVIEVVTEGILTRMIQSDPDLPGVGTVIFDEFHERALTADLGLALAWEVRGALRPDLRILVMSATLDAAPVAALLGDAPVLTAQGIAFPVETRWLDRPLQPGSRWDGALADLIAQAARDRTEGALLAFLPGEAEIRRVAALLDRRLPDGCAIRPLYGALPAAEQRAALAPLADARKIVLATAIAETSLTLPDVTVVVDGGRARRSRFDPGSGMGRLVTERVSRAEADQRRGRAGRVAPGVCYRLWTRGEEGALPAFAPPEIATADLAGLALELALWGSDDGLVFLTPPPEAALAEARALLRDLGALDEGGRVTDHGRRLAAMPLHPRLGHMLALAGPRAAPLAALLADRDILRGAPCDLAPRLLALEDLRAYETRHPWPVDRAARDRVRAEAARLARAAHGGDGQGGRHRRARLSPKVPQGEALSPAEMAALAYPDRIGLRRPGDAPRWVLSGGKGAAMDPGDPLAGTRLIVATDLDGDPREARIRQAAPLADSALRALFGDRIRWHEDCCWSRRDRQVRARRQERFGALVLDDRPWADAPPEAVARAALDGLRDLGLAACGMTDTARRLQARVALLRAEGANLPDLSDMALLENGESLLLPFLARRRTEADLRALDLTEALRAALGWEGMQRLDALAPATFVTPLGRAVPIDYATDPPGIALRLQELFGVTEHPAVGPKRLPLRLTLLSPAGRPVQVTADLPGFWATSYADVRKDMRGQYPKHPWPEDPTKAEPTLRAKPRSR